MWGSGTSSIIGIQHNSEYKFSQLDSNYLKNYESKVLEKKQLPGKANNWENIKNENDFRKVLLTTLNKFSNRINQLQKEIQTLKNTKSQNTQIQNYYKQTAQKHAFLMSYLQSVLNKQFTQAEILINKQQLRKYKDIKQKIDELSLCLYDYEKYCKAKQDLQRQRQINKQYQKIINSLQKPEQLNKHTPQILKLNLIPQYFINKITNFNQNYPQIQKCKQLNKHTLQLLQGLNQGLMKNPISFNELQYRLNPLNTISQNPDYFTNNKCQVNKIIKQIIGSIKQSKQKIAINDNKNLFYTQKQQVQFTNNLLKAFLSIYQNDFSQQKVHFLMYQTLKDFKQISTIKQKLTQIRQLAIQKNTQSDILKQIYKLSLLKQGCIKTLDGLSERINNLDYNQRAKVKQQFKKIIAIKFLQQIDCERFDKPKKQPTTTYLQYLYNNFKNYLPDKVRRNLQYYVQKDKRQKNSLYNCRQKIDQIRFVMTGTTVKDPCMNPKISQFYSQFTNTIAGIAKFMQINQNKLNKFEEKKFQSLPIKGYKQKVQPQRIQNHLNNQVKFIKDQNNQRKQQQINNLQNNHINYLNNNKELLQKLQLHYNHIKSQFAQKIPYNNIYYISQTCYARIISTIQSMINQIKVNFNDRQFNNEQIVTPSNYNNRVNNGRISIQQTIYQKQNQIKRLQQVQIDYINLKIAYQQLSESSSKVNPTLKRDQSQKIRLNQVIKKLKKQAQGQQNLQYDQMLHKLQDQKQQVKGKFDQLKLQLGLFQQSNHNLYQQNKKLVQKNKQLTQNIKQIFQQNNKQFSNLNQSIKDKQKKVEQKQQQIHKLKLQIQQFKTFKQTQLKQLQQKLKKVKDEQIQKKDKQIQKLKTQMITLRQRCIRTFQLPQDKTKTKSNQRKQSQQFQILQILDYQPTDQKDCRVFIQNLKNTLKKGKQQVGQLKKNLQSMINQIIDYKQKFQSIQKKTKQQLQGLNKEIKQTQQKLRQSQLTILNLNQQIKQLQLNKVIQVDETINTSISQSHDASKQLSKDQIYEFKQSKNEAQTHKSITDEEIQNIQKQLQKKTEQYNVLVKQKQQLIKQNKTLSDQLEKVRSQRQEVDKSLIKSKEQCSNIRTQLQTSQSQCDRIGKQVKILTDKITTINAQLQSSKGLIIKLTNELQALKNINDLKQKQLNLLKDNNQSLLNEKQDYLDKLQSQNQSEETLKKQQTAQSASKLQQKIATITKQLNQEKLKWIQQKSQKRKLQKQNLYLKEQIQKLSNGNNNSETITKQEGQKDVQQNSIEVKQQQSKILQENNTLKTQIQTLKKTLLEFDKRGTQIQALRNQLASANHQLKRLKDQINNLTKRLQELKKKQDQKQKQSIQLKDDNKTLLNEKLQFIDTIKQPNQPEITVNKQSTTQSTSQLQQKVASLTKLLTEEKRKWVQQKTKKRQLQKQIIDLKEQIQKLKNGNSNIETIKNQVEQNTVKNVEQNNNSTQQQHKIKQENSSLKKQIQTLKAKIDKLQSQIKQTAKQAQNKKQKPSKEQSQDRFALNNDKHQKKNQSSKLTHESNSISTNISSDELKIIKIKLLNVELDLSEKKYQNQNLNLQILKLKKQIKQLQSNQQASVQTIKKQIQTKHSAQLLSLASKHQQQLTKQQNEFKTQLQKKQKQSLQLTSKIQHLTKQLTKQLQQSNKKSSQLSQKINKHQIQMFNLNKTLKQTEQKFQKTNVKLQQKLKIIEQQQQKHLQVIQAMKIANLKQINKLKAEIKKSNTNISSPQDRFGSADSDNTIYQLRSQINRLKSDTERQNKSRLTKMKELEETSNKLRDQVTKLTNLANQNKKLIDDQQKTVTYYKAYSVNQDKYGKELLKKYLIFDRFFSGQILEDDYQKKFLLANSIMEKTSKRYKNIKKARLIYHYDPKKSINFNQYILGINNILLIVKTSKNIFGGFSTSKIQKDYEQTSDNDAFIFTFNTKVGPIECFDIDYKRDNARSLLFDSYYLNFGNSDIRIKYGENTVYSNFDTQTSAFQQKGRRVDALLMEGFVREVQFVTFQCYEVVFEK